MKLYRFTDYRICTGMDYDMESCVSSKAAISCHEYEIVKETKCGYWINLGFSFDAFDGVDKNNCKWVSKTSKKRFAYPTKEEAWEAFVKRKERQLLILKSKLNHVSECLRLNMPQ